MKKNNKSEKTSLLNTKQVAERRQFLSERRKLVPGTKKFVLAVLVKHLSRRKPSLKGKKR